MHLTHFNTLGLIDPKKIRKPSLVSSIAALSLFSPIGAVTVLTAHEIQTHPDQVKSTLDIIGSEIKKDAPVVASTLTNAGKTALGTLNGVFDKLMLPIIIIGAIVAMSILKK